MSDITPGELVTRAERSAYDGDLCLAILDIASAIQKLLPESDTPFRRMMRNTEEPHA